MKAKYKAVILRWVFPLIGLLLAVLLVYLGTIGKEKKEAKEVVESMMLDVVERHAAMIRTELLNVQNAGELIVSLIDQGNVRASGKISQYLKAVTDQTNAYAAVYVDGHGLSVNQDGEKVDLTDKSWFSEELFEAGAPKYFYLRNAGTEEEEDILILIPNSKGSGALYLWYSAENLKDLMIMNEDFNRPVIGLLLDREGNILAHTGVNSDFTKDTNLWNNLNEAGNEIAIAKSQFQAGDLGAIKASAGNENRTLIYVPVSVGEWYFMAGLDQAYVDRREKNLWENTGRVLGLVLAAVVVFAVFFVVTNILGKIKNDENSKVLQEKADTDLLTGLNNKLATERKIKEYMEENPDDLAMMFLLDIDNFKKINDTMGHAFGDEVLRTLGKKISANFRMTDIIGRTGGDEFTIFLKALKDDSNTLREAQKLVNFFRNFQVGEYVKYSATASIGAAVFPAHGKDFETLYKAADQALYKAKKRGKNQLAFYDDRDRK
ncbi:MAG: diguanylate cyclase [Bacillota bacterium]|nr:diguanylate cyclase [Bacillota bacterium]